MIENLRHIIFEICDYRITIPIINRYLQDITLPAAHLILNVSQKFGMCKKGFYNGCYKKSMSIIFEIPFMTYLNLM